MSTHDTFAEILDLLARSGVEYALIGGHAVNAWLEPRFTADVDVTIRADAPEIDRLKQVLGTRGYRVAREHGANLPSGPREWRPPRAVLRLVLSRPRPQHLGRRGGDSWLR